MNGLIMTAQLLAGISLLVFIHELGHFLSARMFGIRVEKFFLFFDTGGFKLFSFKIGETEYGMGWLPLGGYCKIAGMVDESLDSKNLKQEAQPWEYRSKPAWQRFIVIIAGVVLNFIMGIVIFAALLLDNEQVYLPLKEVNTTGIYASSFAQEQGLRTGDKIISINGKTPVRFKDVQSPGIFFGGYFEVERDGKQHHIPISPDLYQRLMDNKVSSFIEASNYPVVISEVVEDYPAHKAGLQKGDQLLFFNHAPISSMGEYRELVFGYTQNSFELGYLRGEDTLSSTIVLQPGNKYTGIFTENPYRMQEYTFFSALYYASMDAVELISSNAKGLSRIFSQGENISESIQGPIGIATIYGGTWNWYRFWYVTAMISLILAFMNILPIPGLDGGHLIFTLYEMISGRKPSVKFLMAAQMVGMLLLLALFIFVMGNDLIRLIFK